MWNLKKNNTKKKLKKKIQMNAQAKQKQKINVWLPKESGASEEQSSVQS